MRVRRMVENMTSTFDIDNGLIKPRKQIEIYMYSQHNDYLSGLDKHPDERRQWVASAVSPEAVGFLSAVGLFIIVLLILFLYINKKMCFENIGGIPDLNSRYSARKNSQEKPSDSVTEQVTSMINSLRTDDTATTQGDQFVVAKENNAPLNYDTEKHMREESCSAEEKHTEIDTLKQNTNVGKETHHNKHKNQCHINLVESNKLLSNADICKIMDNSAKCTKQRGSDSLEVTFSKDISQNCNSYRQEKSLKGKSKESHEVLEPSEDQFQVKVKKHSPGADSKNTKEVHAVESRNVEVNEEYKSKLSESRPKKVHDVHEVKGKKSKTLYDGHRQSITKQEESVSSALSKKSTKKKAKECFSKEVGSKTTPEKDNSYLNKDQRGSSSESEDEALGKYHETLSRTQSSRPPAGDSRQQKNYIWETRQKYSPLSAEYDGYSSEASIDEVIDMIFGLQWRLVHLGKWCITPT
ncbi:hypothetical protein JD844_025292 [Phrynosoma platyrhinos]|uniref:Uncharacterized protein n=1 Tax=Phrynosoma platyrhinos TaxID=52577 RepID=A0ABQ7SZK3_PHRPL|nr:hypothetical protein JD844_025292 [Phrynosoma platyrhinos]